MLRHTARRSSFPSWAAAGVALAAFAFAAIALDPGVATAAAPDAGSATTPAEQWKGRFCTKTSCAGSSAAPWGQAAAFGAAVAATGLLARRRE
jgi:hypothetical protein